MVTQSKINFLRKIGMHEQADRLGRSECPFCGKKVDPTTEFKDELSWSEFNISGLCQACQDAMFSPKPVTRLDGCHIHSTCRGCPEEDFCPTNNKHGQYGPEDF